MYTVVSSSLTDIGNVREANEDSVLESGNLFAVADGMGGHLAGEVASSMALSLIRQYVEEGIGLVPGEQLIEKAITAANAAVHQKAVSSARFREMGTTVTALYREGDTAYIGHVGDSSAYLFRDGKLDKLTRDHSLVARLVEDGEISAEEARVHTQRNIILRALGLDPRVEVDVVSVKIRPGDRFLLATDGLTGMVGDGEIERVIAGTPEPEDATRRLVDLALAAGGVDNISAVLVAFDPSTSMVPSREAGAHFEGEEPGVVEVVTPGPPAAGVKRRRVLPLAVALALAAMLAAMLAVGYYFYTHTYFVGEREGKVVLFRGFPFWGLAGVEEETDIDVHLLSAASRRKLEGGMEVESRAGALETMEALKKEAENYTLVPNVVGMRYEEAKKRLEAAGLHVVEPPELVSSENAEEGTVFAQDPEGYSRVGKGEDIRLRVVGGKSSKEV